MRIKITLGRLAAFSPFFDSSFVEDGAACASVCVSAHTRTPMAHNNLLVIMGLGVVDGPHRTLRGTGANFELNFPYPEGRRSTFLASNSSAYT